MIRRNLKWILFILCAVLAIVVVTNLKPQDRGPLYDEPSECQALMPKEDDGQWFSSAPKERVMLDFEKKEQLGIDKYGFRKTFEVKDKVTLQQQLFTCGEDFVYGIYKDPNLNQSLKRIMTKEQWRIYNAIEMGADEEDFPNYSEDIEIELEPGTYYLSVYTTHKNEIATIEYGSRMKLLH